MMMNVYMFSLTQFIVDFFSDYVRSTAIAIIYNVQVKNMLFYKFFFSKSIFIIGLIVSFTVQFTPARLG